MSALRDAPLSKLVVVLLLVDVVVLVVVVVVVVVVACCRCCLLLSINSSLARARTASFIFISRGAANTENTQEKHTESARETR
jgi:hypothetical protein